MTPRQAILKAASRLEKNPRSYVFIAPSVPDNARKDTYACALGWIGHYAGKEYQGLGVFSVATEFLGVTEGAFYRELRRPGDGQEKSFVSDARLCAARLREYADKFHKEAA